MYKNALNDSITAPVDISFLASVKSKNNVGNFYLHNSMKNAKRTYNFRKILKPERPLIAIRQIFNATVLIERLQRVWPWTGGAISS
jgi:hypothetical protein